MKILHLGDLHIGKILNQHSLIEDQKYILSQVVSYAKNLNIDVVIIAGDVYDKSIPSTEAIEVFDNFLDELSTINDKLKIVIIAGNHDSAERLEFASSILGRQGVIISGKPPMQDGEYMKKLELEDEYGKLNIYLLPYTKPAHVRAYFKEDETITYERAVEFLINRESYNYDERNILVAHQFFVGKIRPETSDSEILKVGGIDEIGIKTLENFDYVALGHIHKAQCVGDKNIRYAGTLLKYSLSELNHKKILTLVEFDEKTDSPTISELDIKPLRELKELRGSLEELIKSVKEEDKENYIYIVLTDEVENPNAKQVLENYYKNILDIRIDNARTAKLKYDFNHKKDIEELSDIKLWENFFEEFQGREMNDKERELIISTLNETLEESV